MNLEIFSDNLERLFDAPNSVDNLRELILTLAIRGKLVPQNPNDEPASKLIIKINSEKEHLITEKKIRSPKLLPPVESNFIPFQIPENWQWVRLGNVGQIVGGGTPKTNHPEYFAKIGIPWFTPADLYKLNKKFITRGKRDISEIGLKKSSAQLMPVGTVIFSSRAPIGYVAIALNELATNQGFKSCIPFVMDMNEYIYYFLKFAGKEIDRNASGTTFKEVSGKKVSHILLPLPPLNEQKRIVTKVDQLMALCDQLEARQQEKHEQRIRLNNAALDKFLTAPTPEELSLHWQRICDNFDLLYDAPETVGQLRQAILQLAVQGKLVAQNPEDEPALVLLEEINNEKERLVKDKKISKIKPLPPIKENEISYELPEKWMWTRLGEALIKITDGTHHSPLNGPKGDFKYITAKNIKSKGINLSNITYVSAKVHEEIYNRCDPEPGNILYIKDGATTGIVTINDLNEQFSMLSSVALLKNPSKIYNRYLLYVLRSPYFYSLMRNDMSGVAITRVTLTKLNRALIPLAPFEEQKRIVAKVDQLMALCDELEAGLAQAQTDGGKLMEAVVHHVLAG